jgi:GTPase SAR1 family protein
MVQQCYQYLHKFVSTVNGEGIITEAEMQPLFRLHSESHYFASGVPRIILIGEFKAGKSTLMNALLRGDYAATDILEMTSWIARYWPSEVPFCRIRYSDGHEVEVSPDLFRKKCQERGFSTGELALIARVDIGVPVSTLNFSIIDCPGLGSVTRENERLMIEALRDADMILWAVDVDSIGGMKEGALLRKLLSQGMPHIAVLTKCDLASDAEVEEIRQYLGDEFSLNPGDIFATSARRAVERTLQNQPIGLDTGIPQLEKFISTEVTTRHQEIRSKAEKSHSDRMRELALVLVGRVYDELSAAKESLDKFQSIAQSMRRAVQGQLEMEVEGMVRERMFAGHRSAIVGDIQASLKSGNSSLSTDNITEIFRKNLGERYLDAFWQDISTSMTTSASLLWIDKLKDVQVELEEICQRFQSASWHEFSATQSPQSMALNISAISEETFSTALKTSMGIASFATVYAAATAHVSLMAAATGVGIPIAAIGAVVSSALFYFQKNKSQNAAHLEATFLVDSYVKHFIEEILRPHLFPQIADLNVKIEKQIVAGFEENLRANLPKGSLEEMIAESLKYNHSWNPNVQ